MTALSSLDPTARLRGTAPPFEVDKGCQGRAPEATSTAPLTFDRVYEENFDFVWRSLLRMGIDRSSIDDAAQDVFVVVHRRLVGFEGRSSIKSWLFGIARNVTKDHRRRFRRKGGLLPLRDELVDMSPSPFEHASDAEAVATLDAILDRMDVDRRAVFILAEIEELPAPQIADALGVGLNTVYSRLRLARRDFNALSDLLLREEEKR